MLAVTPPIPLTKRWFLVDGARCRDRAVVTAARGTEDAVTPESMGVSINGGLALHVDYLNLRSLELAD